MQFLDQLLQQKKRSVKKAICNASCIIIIIMFWFYSNYWEHIDSVFCSELKKRIGCKTKLLQLLKTSPQFLQLIEIYVQVLQLGFNDVFVFLLNCGCRHDVRLVPQG